MIKKVIFVISLLLLTLPIVVYASEDENTNELELRNDNIEIIPKVETKNYENMCVDIKINEDGFYSLMSNVQVHYVNGEIDYLSLDEPTLLSFVISSQYNHALWLLDKNEGEKIINNLTELKNELEKQGDDEQAIKIKNIIEYFKNIGPITGAST